MDKNELLREQIQLGDYDRVESLLDVNVDVNYSDDGTTVLHVAASNGHLKIAKLLIDRGANVNADGCNPMAMISGVTPLHLAAQNGHLGVCKFLVDKGARIDDPSFNITPLCAAIYYKRTEVINFLVSKKANVNGKCENDKLSFWPLTLAIDTKQPLTMKLLIDNGANVNLTEPGEREPLLAASQKGSLEIVKSLIEMGADVNKKGMHDFTALHPAAGLGHLEIVKFLIEKGANIDSEDENGHTPLSGAAILEQMDCIRLLLHCGAALDLELLDKGEVQMEERKLLEDVYHRRWRPDIHFCFPKETRKEIFTLLLLQNREGNWIYDLPNEIFMLIVTFVATADRITKRIENKRKFDGDDSKSNKEVKL